MDKIAADEAEAKEAAREERRKRRRAEVEPKKRRQEAEGRVPSLISYHDPLNRRAALFSPT